MFVFKSLPKTDGFIQPVYRTCHGSDIAIINSLPFENFALNLAIIMGIFPELPDNSDNSYNLYLVKNHT